MILLIDNYDSFVYNVVRYVLELGYQATVIRNDQITLPEISDLKPSHIIISPGPCTPLEAGISNEMIRSLGARIPILGICLGHQCIGHVFGAQVVRARRPVHGKVSTITHTQSGIFKGLPHPLNVTRYHSLIVQDLPENLSVTATSQEGEVMAMVHREYPIVGVQFHPEAVLTQGGHSLLKNFLQETYR